MDVVASPMVQLLCSPLEPCRLCGVLVTAQPTVVLACGHYFHEVPCIVLIHHNDHVCAVLHTRAE